MQQKEVIQDELTKLNRLKTFLGKQDSRDRIAEYTL
jgi:hypothetical protein